MNLINPSVRFSRGVCPTLDGGISPNEVVAINAAASWRNFMKSRPRRQRSRTPFLAWCNTTGARHVSYLQDRPAKSRIVGRMTASPLNEGVTHTDLATPTLCAVGALCLRRGAKSGRKFTAWPAPIPVLHFLEALDFNPRRASAEAFLRHEGQGISRPEGRAAERAGRPPGPAVDRC
jgi:hypothetical protein